MRVLQTPATLRNAFSSLTRRGSLVQIQHRPLENGVLQVKFLRNPQVKVSSEVSVPVQVRILDDMNVPRYPQYEFQ
jgi:hypothetical protein